MSLRGTSEAVNEAVETIRAELDRLRKKAQKKALRPEERTALLAMTDQLRQIEHGRADVLVAAIAGKRGLDKLPPHELEQVVKALAGVEPGKTKGTDNG